MAHNTSDVLGNYFEQFVSNIISEGRYNNAGEVIRAGLRLLEDHENKVKILREAIQEGLESGVAEDFNSEDFLEELKKAI